MGQKTNPIGIRIGINKTWDSTWFDEKNYASKLHEDILIREFLNKNYINPTGKEASIPHPLDEKNVPELPDSHFPKLWNI